MRWRYYKGCWIIEALLYLMCILPYICTYIQYIQYSTVCVHTYLHMYVYTVHTVQYSMCTYVLTYVRIYSTYSTVQYVYICTFSQLKWLLFECMFLQCGYVRML